MDKTNPRSVFWDHVRHMDMDRVWTPQDRYVSILFLCSCTCYMRETMDVLALRGLPRSYIYKTFCFPLNGRNISNMTMDFLANFARWGSPTPIIKPEDRPPGYEPYDDFLYNLTWTPFNPGNHYLYINASLHQPYGCSYKYVFDHTIPIGGTNPVGGISCRTDVFGTTTWAGSFDVFFLGKGCVCGVYFDAGESPN